jgi:predicted DNA-binding protein with PD1-like motif
VLLMPEKSAWCCPVTAEVASSSLGVPAIFSNSCKTPSPSQLHKVAQRASVLQQFGEASGFRGSSFKAIGALSYAKLGWFNLETKKYGPACVLHEQVELLSLIGDIALRDGEPQVHAHVVVGRSDGTAHGGHLLEARVRPTCELILTESPSHLQKKLDPKSGIALIQI